MENKNYEVESGSKAWKMIRQILYAFLLIFVIKQIYLLFFKNIFR